MTASTIRRAVRRAGKLGVLAVARRAADVLRARARRALPAAPPGSVTVVTVNFNSEPFLRVLVAAVRRYSPPDVRILVVDNASAGGLRAFRADHPDVRVVRLPLNIGHAPALDIGCLLARTEFVVTLDVDAFPLRERWLDDLLAPLGRGYTIAGARLNREYVHPCCLAVRLDRFVARRHSFEDHYVDGAGDVGELMAARDGGPLYFFDPTSQRGPGSVGTVFGGIVYHNFYSTRFTRTSAASLDDGVGRDDPALAWNEALAKYLRPAGVV